jgi:hypothetical protein
MFEGPQGLKSLINISDEPVSSNCKIGGLKITTGIDKNKNDVLDPDEITTTKFLCNPENGISSIVLTTIEPSGVNCSQGGVRVEVGNDLNSNGQLSTNEIQQTRFICNGAIGLATLINTTAEPAGSNCTYGGTMTESGIDVNVNGLLDPTEIKQTTYTCNGKNGEMDKEIRFLLGPISNYSGTLAGPYSNIFEFDIRNYPSIDSAVFVVFGVGTYDSNGQPKIVDGTFQLYDDTNGQVIANSSIVSDDIPLGVFKMSRNFIKDLPQQSINLRTDVLTDPTSNIISQNSYLILRRK